MKSKSKSKITTDLAMQTAQEFVQVQDIHGNFLHTQDGWLMSYVRIFPISLDLLSSSEKQMLISKLTAELSSSTIHLSFLR